MGVASGDSINLDRQLATCRLDELCPHPSYIRHGLSVSSSQLSAIIALGDLAFLDPIRITLNREVIDGYARLELARKQKRTASLCIEYDLNEEESLRWLIQTHLPSRGLNSYCRILLALDLEPSLQQQARANQRAGGQNKGSSNLTEAQRLDVRAQIATAAGASAGNVTKVKQLRKKIPPREVELALRTGEISIHKAWQWCHLSVQQQVKELAEDRSRRGTTQTSRRQIQRHIASLSANRLILPKLGDLLKPLVSDRAKELDSITFAEIDSPGNIAYFTKDALKILNSLEASKCVTESY
jgi:hypothetical protein